MQKLGTLLLYCAPAIAWGQTTVSVTTHHNDNFRTGVNPAETILTPASVSAGNFGKLFSLPVSGQVYAQPLYLSSVAIPNQGTHNVLYVATELNNVYAFDADSPGPALWQVNLGNPYPTCCSDLAPYQGITSTPVIDPTTNSIYLVSETWDGLNATWKLHSLDVTTGLEQRNSPVVIQGSVAGTGDGSVNGVLAFNPAQHRQRTALLLVSGVVYFGFAGVWDTPPFHGWLFGYDGGSMRRAVFKCFTPNGIDGGLWQGGAGFASDGLGYIYAVTGNGTFSAATGGSDYSMSVLKIKPATGLTVTDYFTPADYLPLDGDDDLGVGGPLLIPGASTLVTGSKQGAMYVLGTSALGGFNPAGDRVIQEWQAVPWGLYGTPVYYNSTLYYWGAGSQLQAFSRAANGTFSSSSQGSVTDYSFGWTSAAALSVSGSGPAGPAIVWATYPPSGQSSGGAFPSMLRAFDASNVAVELWASDPNTSGANYAGSWSKWCPPTIANGKVYVATFDNAVNVFGLQ